MGERAHVREGGCSEDRGRAAEGGAVLKAWPRPQTLACSQVPGPRPHAALGQKGQCPRAGAQAASSSNSRVKTLLSNGAVLGAKAMGEVSPRLESS